MLFSELRAADRTSPPEKRRHGVAEQKFDLLNDLNGTAALGICESLLLALVDLNIISGKVLHDVLSDVITTHSSAAELSDEPDKHRAVAEIVKRMLSGKPVTTGKDGNGGNGHGD
jgi:hypothetical protein